MRRSNARRVSRNRNHQDCTDNNKMDSLKLQFRPNAPYRFTNIFSNHRTLKNQNTKFNLVLFSFSILILFIFCYLFIFSVNSNEKDRRDRIANRKFGIVIDGGSTGTRIHVFEYQLTKDGILVCDFAGEGWDSMRVNPGLSSYKDDLEGAGRSLADLIEFGKTRVPKESWDDTEIRLMATAGIRMLAVEAQDRILESCRRVLRLSGFKFRDDWASVISGSDEGIYAWVIANYALGTFGGDPLQTTGIIELGGASAQVTFISSEPLPPEYSHKVKYGNFTYNLYSHSLLQFGQNVALDLLRESLYTGGLDTEHQKGKPLDPCTPKGYRHDTHLWKLSPSSLNEKHRSLLPLLPSGNFSECRAASLKLLERGKDKCSYEHCYIGSTYIPKLQGKFLATENFFHTSKFFGLAPQTFLSELMVAGQQFCEEDWSNLKRKYPSLKEEDLVHYCFSSAYIVALLHDSLEIALDDDRIEHASHVRDIPLDWALGAFILQTTYELDVEHSNWTATIFGNDFSTLLALVGVSLLLMFIGWSISKWKKPQLKTIYDLEKGRYIVTRVGRSS